MNARIIGKKRVIHIGDPGSMMAKCGAKPTSMKSALSNCDESAISNWVFKPEAADCKRCLAIYRRDCGKYKP
jgi:hypothetical protein